MFRIEHYLLLPENDLISSLDLENGITSTRSQTLRNPDSFLKVMFDLAPESFRPEIVEGSNPVCAGILPHPFWMDSANFSNELIRFGRRLGPKTNSVGSRRN